MNADFFTEVKRDLGGTGLCGMDWIHLARETDQVMNLGVL